MSGYHGYVCVVSPDGNRISATFTLSVEVVESSYQKPVQQEIEHLIGRAGFSCIEALISSSKEEPKDEVRV